MTREWAIHAYKARLDSAIEAERWDEADRVRVAAKRRLLELVSKGGPEEIAAARDALADSFERLRLAKRVRIDKGALATGTRLMADAETAGIAAEQAPLHPDTARDVKERILQILSSGNRRPHSTTDLANQTARRVETVARAISQLRAEGRIVSRRIGRYVLHRIAEPRYETLNRTLRATANAPVEKRWYSEWTTTLGRGRDRGSKGSDSSPMPSAPEHKIASPDGAKANEVSSLLNEERPSPPTGEWDIISSKQPVISHI